MALDMISSLPSSLIETILCFLPIQEAARTSILSREWRYNWTTIPKLVLDENTFEVSINNLSDPERTVKIPSLRIRLTIRDLVRRCKFLCAMDEIMLLHRGPILELSLSMYAENNCIEVDQIIAFLSRQNTVRKLKLDLDNVGNQKIVPLSIFSLDQLTDLSLEGCDIELPPSSTYGFASLYIWMTDIDDDYLIIELFECLPVIKHLTIWSHVIECIAGGLVPSELPMSLVNLKYFCLNQVCFTHSHALPFLVLVLKSSPNLEKLKLRILPEDLCSFPEDYLSYIAPKDYSDICLGHLDELEIRNFTNLETELEFVKFMLAKSPTLKRLRIYLYKKVPKDVELIKLLKVLLHSPQASPVVDIIVKA
uniref:F-box/FBD/LRR-repeat protein At1g13570-like n=1 Tax=Erigeron canadensis TaxID=72917 RepID=UPI001CB904EC|nr:F-box/FBD/LRR-repeat protein At1g13570-like [Erigeron canadensis]